MKWIMNKYTRFCLIRVSIFRQEYMEKFIEIYKSESVYRT